MTTYRKVITVFLRAVVGCTMMNCSFLVNAQNTLDFRQFYFNPFLYNPAYAGMNEKPEFSLIHRRQWVDFEDAPTASGFSYRHGVSKSFGAGFVFQTQKTIALRTSTAQAACAFRVPIGKKQSVKLALSGGMGNNDLDLEGRDFSNDPLILNAADNKIFMMGSFGLLYSWSSLDIGINFPSLINNQQPGSGILKSRRFEQLLDQIYTVRYKFPSDESVFSVEPYFIFRQYRDNQSFWDAGSLLHYRDQLWIGAAYHEFQGMAFLFGCNIKKTLRISYDYELPTARKNELSSVSHELQLSISLHDENKERAKEKRKR